MVESTSQINVSEQRNVTNYDDPAYAKFKNVLKGAQKGQVVTRFPPEPSGYLHIGHVKAAMLNYHYAKMYEGQMILRFDDTNPMNEKIEFVENIIRDLKTLQIYPDRVTYTSDYFDQTKEYMEQLIKLGMAYADDTPADQMKIERDAGIESKYREATVEENLARFHLMLKGLKEDPKLKEEEKKGTTEEKKKSAKNKEEKKKEKEEARAAKASEVVSDWCMRAKLNMQNPVKCLRDPVFYRIKRDPHHRTGSKYLAYPTYDFACPIVDALEDVSHCLRTIEYHDRNALYDWVQEKLGLRKVAIYDYSRLNLVSTILSKRSLKWFVESNHAENWYDPRFPTVQGIMRRGLTVDALKLFMLEQGPSKNTNLMEWDKLWALNKQYIDPIAPRYTAIVKSSSAKVILENMPEQIEAKSVSLHPKNDAVGSKAVIFGKYCWIERDDAEGINEGEKIALRNYGKVLITKKAEVDGFLTLYGTYDQEDKDFKKAKIVTWICADEGTTVEIELIEFGHLITKKKVEETDDVKQLVNLNSRVQYTALAEGSMRHLQHGQIIQLERRGFFFVDQISHGDKKLVLNYIPDGKQNPMSKLPQAIDPSTLQKGNDENKVSSNNAEAKKLQQAKAQVDGVQAQPEGEVKGPSKKDLKKAAKKEQKKAGKAVAKDKQGAVADDQQVQQPVADGQQVQQPAVEDQQVQQQLPADSQGTQ